VEIFCFAFAVDVSHRAALTPLARARLQKTSKACSPANKSKQALSIFVSVQTPSLCPFCRCTIQHLLHPEAAECEVDHCDGERRHAVLGAGFPLVSIFHCLASRESLGTILRPKLVESYFSRTGCRRKLVLPGLEAANGVLFCQESIFGPAWLENPTSFQYYNISANFLLRLTKFINGATKMSKFKQKLDRNYHKKNHVTRLYYFYICA